MMFESHAHYDDEAFDTDREQLLREVKEMGVDYIMNIGAGLDSIKSSIALTEQYDFIYASVGVHPGGTAELTEEKFDWLKQQCLRDKVLAVGEVGLDYYWPEPDRQTQQYWFRRQISLAKELELPLIIHSRDAAADTLRIMKEEGADRLRGVIHCYSYTKETAREFLQWGYYFGIGGVITFQNAKKLREAVACIPIENILLETDCPYLAPTPHRGKRNSSLYLPLIAKAIAEVKGLDYEQVVEITHRNAGTLYRI